MKYKDLLIPIFRKGKCVYQSPSLHEIRAHTLEELEHFSPAVRRFLYPEPYFVGLEKSVYKRKLELIESLRSRL